MLNISSSENLWYCSIICSSHVYFFIGQGESSAATSEEALLCWKSLLLSSVASHSSLLVCSCTTCLGLKQASLRRQKEKAGAPPKRLQSTNTALKRQQMATYLIAENTYACFLSLTPRLPERPEVHLYFYRSLWTHIV